MEVKTMEQAKTLKKELAKEVKHLKEYKITITKDSIGFNLEINKSNNLIGMAFLRRLINFCDDKCLYFTVKNNKIKVSL